MRSAVLLTMLLSVGCHAESTTARPDRLVATTDAKAAEVASDTAKEDGESDAETPPVDVAPIPTRTALRTRFTTAPLTMADHGIDGTFELWRDSRLDDKRVAKEWFTAAYVSDTMPAGFETIPAASAQLILRDSRGTIVESLDLALPLATMESVRLGDDVVPYFQVGIDTYGGMGRWGATTHRFVRVEAGRSHWLECATAYSCALGCRFYFDTRPSGGFDLLTWRHWYVISSMNPVTHLTRIEVKAGTCSTATKTAKGWLGEYGSGTAIPSASGYPPRI